MNLLKRKTRESSETQSTTMEVYFSGPSVDEHSMSGRDLAPALIGLADAIDRYKELPARSPTSTCASPPPRLAPST